ncbi:hypothetical protein BKN38_03790 [Helicobacter sp. CLO-3]|uniref:vacuolating cytotoxin domain-containing protein n=1 Tax=unclassified Helicobacter TaxID=2593540 RepID=UPI000804EA04|nr:MULTISPECIES: vacuolating cytotoxin domain-containing protein [unclassified Helicobacter]OBV29375.1 hypothetical protein BA723_05685 [Helicobacter sp. CLO-3]OHU84156.1 hypothetical protein BKN38_03790 [Helicobacter sp. CLO-3]
MIKHAQSAPAITRTRHAQNTAHAKATKPAQTIKAALSSSLLLLGLAFPSVAVAATDIWNKDMYCLYNNSSIAFTNCGSWNYTPNTNNSSSDIFYVKSGETYREGFGTFAFTTNYTNGTLIFGNDKKEQGSGQIHLGSGGGGGHTAYLNGTFNVKEAYFTGTLTTGNNTGAGAGASLTFNANENITTQGFNANFWSNTQGATLALNSKKDITINSSTFTIDGSNSNFTAKANGKFSANGFTLSMPGTTESINANISAKEIDIKNGSLSTGTSSTAGVYSTTSFTSTGGDINFDASTTTNFKTENVIFKSTNGSINLAGTTVINSGELTTNANINFNSDKNITLGNADIKINYGSGALNMKASENLTIDKINLNFDLITAATYSHATFEGANIDIKSGNITTTPGASTSNSQIDFKSSGSINLGTTNLNIQLGTSGKGGRLNFSGASLTHTGKLIVGRDGEGTGEELLDSGIWGAVVDMSNVSGKVSLGDLYARKGTFITNSDFAAKSLYVRRTTGNPTTDINTQENSKLTIDTITIQGGGADNSGHNASLRFNQSGMKAGSSLTSKNVTLNNLATINASNIETTNIQNLVLKYDAEAYFNQLNIIDAGSIVMDVNSTINIKQSFSVDVKQSGNAVDNFGTPLLYVVNAGANMSNINIQAGTIHRFITASGGISYTFTTASGATSTFHCDGGADTLEKCTYIKNSIAIYEGDKVNPTTNTDGSIDYTAGRVDLATVGSNLGLRFEKVVDYSTIGIKALADNPDNPYDIGDIRYYIWQKGGTSRGDEYVSKIAGISTTSLRNETIEQIQNGQKVLDSNGNAVMVEVANSDIFDWMQFLSIHSKGITWTGTNIMDYDIDFFYDTATQLYNTLGQVASTERKSSMASSTRLAADIAKIQRLVKVSRSNVMDRGDTRFAEYLKSLKGKRFASNDASTSGVASDYAESSALDPAFLYKFSNRHDYNNNIWATAIGSASFVINGHGTLYGINTGYDRFIPVGESGVIVGAFGAYGYGSYTADLIKNHSHNVNAGIYSRAFIGNSELDLNIGYTIGMNNEDIHARQNVWLSALDQSYRYNTHTMNLNASYGYVFGVKNGSLVFKPAVGLGYYLMHVGGITGDSAPVSASGAGYGNPNYTFETNETAIQSPKITQNMLTLNLTLETRQYFSEGSYWFVNVGGQKDLFISSGSVTEVRFIGNGALSYKQGDMLNTHLLGTAGGEVMLGKQTFVNFALGGRAGLTYKDLNITANLGARYVF